MNGPFSGEITTSQEDATNRLGEAMKACFWAGVDPLDACQEMYKRVAAEVAEEMKLEDTRVPDEE